MDQDTLWAYRTPGWAERDLIGYKVEALDGDVGKVDEASNEVDFTCLVVDTGPWILGKRVVIPAGLVEEIDDIDRRVLIGRTKEEIKEAPSYHEDLFYDEDFREELQRHFAGMEVHGAAGAQPSERWPDAR